MESFLDGDLAAFEILFNRLAPRLKRSLRLMTGDPHLADDLTQVTFLKLVRARHTYTRGMSVEAWAWTIAKRVYLDDRRQRARKPEVLVADLARLASAHHPDPDRPGSPSERLEQALGALPAAQREALVLLKVHELSANEAAEAMGTTEGAVKMRAQRAFETLRKQLLGYRRR